MLSDEEIDQLENYMVHSTLNDLPALLMRAIPLLLSELRIARAALNAQTESFLKGVSDDLAGKDTPGHGGFDLPGVRTGESVGVHADGYVPVSGEDGDTPTPPQPGVDASEEVAAERPKPRRNRRKKGGDTAEVDGRGSERPVGGEGLRLLSIEPRG